MYGQDSGKNNSAANWLRCAANEYKQLQYFRMLNFFRVKHPWSIFSSIEDRLDWFVDKIESLSQHRNLPFIQRAPNLEDKRQNDAAC